MLSTSRESKTSQNVGGTDNHEDMALVLKEF